MYFIERFVFIQFEDDVLFLDGGENIAACSCNLGFI